MRMQKINWKNYTQIGKQKSKILSRQLLKFKYNSNRFLI